MELVHHLPTDSIVCEPDTSRVSAHLASTRWLVGPRKAAIIQQFLENKAVFDNDSPTGSRKWNADTGKMEPFSHKIDLAKQVTAPVSDLSEAVSVLSTPIRRIKVTDDDVTQAST